MQFIDSDGGPLNESFGVRSRRLRPAAPDQSYLASLDDYEVLSLLPGHFVFLRPLLLPPQQSWRLLTPHPAV